MEPEPILEHALTHALRTCHLAVFNAMRLVETADAMCDLDLAAVSRLGEIPLAFPVAASIGPALSHCTPPPPSSLLARGSSPRPTMT